MAQPLRVALTGSTQSPPIDAVLWALGRTEAMDRILAAADRRRQASSSSGQGTMVDFTVRIAMASATARVTPSVSKG